MSPRDFCYFLRGMMEYSGEQLPTEEQWQNIVSHLKLVMQEVEKPTVWPTLDLSNLDLSLICSAGLDTSISC